MVLKTICSSQNVCKMLCFHTQFFVCTAIFLCVLTTKLVCMRMSAQLRGNIHWERFHDVLRLFIYPMHPSSCDHYVEDLIILVRVTSYQVISITMFLSVKYISNYPIFLLLNCWGEKMNSKSIFHQSQCHIVCRAVKTVYVLNT